MLDMTESKVSSYIAQYPDCSKLFYTLFPWQTCSVKQHLNYSGKHPATLQLMHKDYLYTNTHHWSIARYSFIQQVRVNKLAQSFLTLQHMGSLSRESKPLPVNHCALRDKTTDLQSSRNFGSAFGATLANIWTSSRVTVC